MNASHALAAIPVVARQAAAVAEHLTRTRPTDKMTDAARMTVALVTVDGAAQAVRPVLRVLPFPTGGISRGSTPSTPGRSPGLSAGRRPPDDERDHPRSSVPPGRHAALPGAGRRDDGSHPHPPDW
ncbi:hypothetical protein NKH18_01305 [Streptomyces sp. M10(2022)]